MVFYIPFLFHALGDYAKRQVATWSKQYLASKIDECPAMTALQQYLHEALPQSNTIIR